MTHDRPVIAKNVIRGSINSLKGASEPSRFSDAYIHVRQKMAAEPDLVASIRANGHPVSGLYVPEPEEKRRVDQVLLWQKNGAKGVLGQMTHKALEMLELAGTFHKDMSKQPPVGHPLTFGAQFILLRGLGNTHFTNVLSRQLSLETTAFTNDVLGMLALSINPSTLFKEALHVNYMSFEGPGTSDIQFNNYIATIAVDPVFNTVNVSCDEGPVRGHANLVRVEGMVDAINADITTMHRAFHDAIA